MPCGLDGMILPGRDAVRWLAGGAPGQIIEPEWIRDLIVSLHTIWRTFGAMKYWRVRSTVDMAVESSIYRGKDPYYWLFS